MSPYLDLHKNNTNHLFWNTARKKWRLIMKCEFQLHLKNSFLWNFDTLTTVETMTLSFRTKTSWIISKFFQKYLRGHKFNFHKKESIWLRKYLIEIYTLVSLWRNYFRNIEIILLFLNCVCLPVECNYWHCFEKSFSPTLKNVLEAYSVCRKYPSNTRE